MFEVRSLTADDLDDAEELSAQAGWNQITADWERFLTTCPEGCFAGTVDGELAATTAVITYGRDVSWIGMVLVDERHRSQGYGSRIFERGLEYARDHGGDLIGLDATPLGEPIYRKYGFERVEPVFRWQGTLRASEHGGGERNPAECVEQVTSDDVDTVCEFDRRYVGIDRSALLRELIAEPAVRGYRSYDSTEPTGYVIVRPGRTHWQIGPIVTAQPSTIEPLLRAVSVDFGGCDVIVDTPDRTDITTHLGNRGLSRARELVRMTYPEPESALATDSVHAFLDFAFG